MRDDSMEVGRRFFANGSHEQSDLSGRWHTVKGWLRDIALGDAFRGKPLVGSRELTPS
jgi:hypothetical protein